MTKHFEIAQTMKYFFFRPNEVKLKTDIIRTLENFDKQHTYQRHFVRVFVRVYVQRNNSSKNDFQTQRILIFQLLWHCIDKKEKLSCCFFFFCIVVYSKKFSWKGCLLLCLYVWCHVLILKIYIFSFKKRYFLKNVHWNRIIEWNT